MPLLQVDGAAARASDMAPPTSSPATAAHAAAAAIRIAEANASAGMKPAAEFSSSPPAVVGSLHWLNDHLLEPSTAETVEPVERTGNSKETRLAAPTLSAPSDLKPVTEARGKPEAANGNGSPTFGTRFEV